MNRFLAIVLVVFNLSGIGAQVVNIENKRFYNDTTKFTGRAKFETLGFKNISNVFNFGGSINLQYHWGKSKLMFVGDIFYLISDSFLVDDNAYGHLRYNYQISKLVTFEAYLQAQFNKILKISSRSLGGAGVRLSLFADTHNKLFYGLSGLYERQVDNPDHLQWTAVRMSTYFTYHWQITHIIELANTFYYQPNVIKISDKRLLNEFSIMVDATKWLTFESSLFILHANVHGIDMPDNIWRYDNKLVINF
jgi:Protein of unknown function, DUF481